MINQEWLRLKQDFEREAGCYHDLRVESYFITREGLTGGKDVFSNPNHAIVLYQYFGNDVSDLASPELTVFGVIVGTQAELFRRMAYRAGSLFPDEMRHTLLTAITEKFVDINKPGKPIYSLNRDPLATWLMFLLTTTATMHPNRMEGTALRVDPFAASLTAIDFMLDSHVRQEVLKSEKTVVRPSAIGKLINIYRRMNFMQKLSFWGSVASIISFILVFYPFNVQSGSDGGNKATTYGNQSPAIGENKGDITINYNNVPAISNKNYLLRNARGGAVLVVSNPSIEAAMDQSQHVCTVIAGTPVMPLGETAKLNGIVTWQKVKITGGPCTNKIGWTGIENVSYE